MVRSPSKLTNTVSRAIAETSRSRISIPLLLWLDSFDGASSLRLVANVWREREEGENWMVERARAEEGMTGTMVQLVASGEAVGAHGAMAT